MKQKYKETFTQSIFALMVSQVIVKILGLFYKLYLTNREGFGDEGNAIANGGFQIFAILLSVVGIGIPTAISKIIAETISKGNYKGAYKIFKIALIVFSCIGMAGSFGLFISADFFANNYLHVQEAKLSIVALSPSIFLISIISVLKGFFTGRESIKGTARAQTFEQITKTVTTIGMIEISVVIFNNTNTEFMAALSSLAATLGEIVELAYLYKMYRKEIPTIQKEILMSRENSSPRISNILKRIFIVAIPMSLTALITTISKNIDSTTIIKDLTNLIGYEEAKRQYGILSGKVDALINFPLSFNMAIVTTLLPVIASTGGNLKKQESKINQSFELAMTIAFPVTLFFFGFSNEILQFLFPDVPGGGDLLKVSSISIIFLTIEQITSVIFNAIGKNLIPIKAIIIGVVCKAILNRILVHRIDLVCGGTMGAVIATGVCHLVTAVILYVVLIKTSKIKIKKSSIIKPLVISIIIIGIAKIVYDLLQNNIEFKLSFIIATVTACILCMLIIMPKMIKRNHYCGSHSSEYSK